MQTIARSYSQTRANISLQAKTKIWAESCVNPRLGPHSDSSVSSSISVWTICKAVHVVCVLCE